MRSGVGRLEGRNARDGNGRRARSDEERARACVAGVAPGYVSGLAVMRAFWGALAFGCFCGIALVLAAAFLAGCYDTTGPNVPCSVNSNQQGCLPPVHDRRADGGR